MLYHKMQVLLLDNAKKIIKELAEMDKQGINCKSNHVISSDENIGSVFSKVILNYKVE